MPVIVIGADSPLGAQIVAALLPREGEVRAFVSDVASGAELKGRGVKVAIGDLSDGSHVGAAALHTFSAVAITAAAGDGREVAFADDAAGVIRQWANAIREADVKRVIVVGEDPEGILAGAAPESAVVATSGRALDEIAADVARLDDAAVV